MTGSMQEAIDEVNRRREIQEKYNKEHNINPKTVERQIEESLVDYEIEQEDKINKAKKEYRSQFEIEKEIKSLNKKIQKLAEELNFEEAIKLRDKMNELKKILLEL